MDRLEREASFYGRLPKLRREAKSLKIPYHYPDDLLRKRFEEGEYPTSLTEDALEAALGIKTEEFVQGEGNVHFHKELFCEVFGVCLLMPSEDIELQIILGKSVREIAKEKTLRLARLNFASVFIGCKDFLKNFPKKKQSMIFL